MQQGWIKIVHECDLQEANAGRLAVRAMVGSIWRCYCGNLWKITGFNTETDKVDWEDEFPEEAELRKGQSNGVG